MAGGAISTESASEADSSDQLPQIRLAIKEWKIVFMIRDHICDPNKRMDLKWIKPVKSIKSICADVIEFLF